MGQLRTHYDNLQVVRHANAEVIAAAYRTLSLKYHPDRNGGDERSQKIMRIINRSYEVLSNPHERAAHDLWIEFMEAEPPQTSNESAPKEQTSGGNPSGAGPPISSAQKPVYTPTGFNFFVEALERYSWLVVIIALGSLWAAFDFPGASSSEPPPYISEPTRADASAGTSATQATYSRPLTAPNGSPWPTIAGYIRGEPLLRNNGLSTVTVDNGQNSSDVFVKLVAIDANASLPVRLFFIPANSQFQTGNLDAGEYDVRYMDLDDGSLVRSESFTLKQFEDAGGTRFSNITMTLYKVSNGNMQTYPLAPGEF